MHALFPHKSTVVTQWSPNTLYACNQDLWHSKMSWEAWKGRSKVTKLRTERTSEMEHGFCAGSDGKEYACNAGDPGLIPGSGRSPGGWNGNPLLYSCLENPWTEESGGLQFVELDTNKWLTLHATLYKGLEHPRFSYLWGSWTNPSWILRDIYNKRGLDLLISKAHEIRLEVQWNAFRRP